MPPIPWTVEQRAADLVSFSIFFHISFCFYFSIWHTQISFYVDFIDDLFAQERGCLTLFLFQK